MTRQVSNNLFSFMSSKKLIANKYFDVGKTEKYLFKRVIVVVDLLYKVRFNFFI